MVQKFRTSLDFIKMQGKLSHFRFFHYQFANPKISRETCFTKNPQNFFIAELLSFTVLCNTIISIISCYRIEPRLGKTKPLSADSCKQIMEFLNDTCAGYVPKSGVYLIKHLQV